MVHKDNKADSKDIKAWPTDPKTNNNSNKVELSDY